MFIRERIALYAQWRLPALADVSGSQVRRRETMSGFPLGWRTPALVLAILAMLTTVLAAPAAAQEAMLETVTVTTLRVPGPDPVKTSARLTMLPGTRWQESLVNESFVLTLESGVIRIGLEDGKARVARAPGSLLPGSTLVEIMPGDVATLRAGDRLISHDGGSVWVQNVGAIGASATVIRVGMPTATRRGTERQGSPSTEMQYGQRSRALL